MLYYILCRMIWQRRFRRFNNKIFLFCILLSLSPQVIPKNILMIGPTGKIFTLHCTALSCDIFMQCFHAILPATFLYYDCTRYFLSVLEDNYRARNCHSILTLTYFKCLRICMRKFRWYDFDHFMSQLFSCWNLVSSRCILSTCVTGFTFHFFLFFFQVVEKQKLLGE